MAELIHDIQDRVHAMCYRMLGGRAETADIVQDAVVRIIQGLPGFDGRSAFSTWATRIAINCCLGHLRSEKHRRHASLDAVSEPGGRSRASNLESGEPTTASRIERAEHLRALHVALDEVDPSVRAILVLRETQDLDYDQIAEVLGVRVGTVKSRLFRARAALRDRLAAHGVGPGAESAGGDPGDE